MAAGDDASINTAEEQWSSLTDDLISMVYVRVSSTADRLRFAAVCTSWRACSSRHPTRPVLSWLMLDPRGADVTKRVYGTLDCTAVLPGVPLPSEAAGRCFIGGYDDGWVVSSEAPLGIVNLFSGAEVAYSPEQRRIIRAQQSSGDRLVMRKVVFSEAPTSRGCILAAITDKLGIAICRVGYPEGGWTTQEFHGERRLMDITFCNGELYGIMRYSDKLVKYNIDVNKDGVPMITAVIQINMQNHYSWWKPEYFSYIVELNGKLVMVERTGWWRPSNIFRVYELVASNTHTDNYKWMEMTSLGDYALFLGRTYSKAVHVPTDYGRGGVKRNHIYYACHRCLRKKDEMPVGTTLFPTNSHGDHGTRVCYGKQESTGNGVEKIKSVAYYVRCGLHSPMWLLPVYLAGYDLKLRTIITLS